MNSRRRIFRNAFPILAIAVNCAIPTSAHSATCLDRDMGIQTYQTPGVSLRDILTQLFQECGMTVHVSRKVKGSVTGAYEGTMRAFYQRLLRRHGLSSVEIGDAVYVYAADETTTTAYSVPPELLNSVLRASRATNMRSDAAQILPDRDVGRLVVTAPPIFQQEIAAIVAQTIRAKGPALAQQTQVFRLKYSSAEDIVSKTIEGERRVKGLASILRAALPRDGNTPSAAGNAPPYEFQADRPAEGAGR